MIEHSHAAVAITVRHVDVTILRINHNGGWIEELSLTRIQTFALGSAVGGIENAAFADLEEELSIVSVFLDDAVAVAGYPDIVVLIGITTVNKHRATCPNRHPRSRSDYRQDQR